MRIALFLFLLVLGGCSAAYHTPSDGRLTSRINTAYKARDACLTQYITSSGATSGDPATAANAAAMACTAETDRLIELINVDGDPRVAARIRKDSEFRAMGIALTGRAPAK